MHVNLPSFFPPEVLPEHQSQHPCNSEYGKHTYLWGRFNKSSINEHWRTKTLNLKFSNKNSMTYVYSIHRILDIFIHCIWDVFINCVHLCTYKAELGRLAVRETLTWLSCPWQQVPKHPHLLSQEHLEIIPIEHEQ